MSQFFTFDILSLGYCEVCRDERYMRQFAMQLSGPISKYHYLGMKCTECGNFSVEGKMSTAEDNKSTPRTKSLQYT